MRTGKVKKLPVRDTIFIPTTFLFFFNFYFLNETYATTWIAMNFLLFFLLIFYTTIAHLWYYEINYIIVRVYSKLKKLKHAPCKQLHLLILNLKSFKTHYDIHNRKWLIKLVWLIFFFQIWVINWILLSVLQNLERNIKLLRVKFVWSHDFTKLLNSINTSQ